MYVGFALLSGICFGIAGTIAEGGGPLVGVNVGIGVAAFTLALVLGLRQPKD